MTEYEEALSILRRVEQNQLKSLEMQAEQVAVVKAQMERAEARVQESIALQKVAVSRQAKVTNVLVPVILTALLYAGYVLLKHT